MPSNKHAVCSHALRPSLKPLVLATVMMVTSCSSRTPDGLIVVSRHGVRRQFPSSTHDFSKYAPGKTFETEDKVCLLCVSGGVLVLLG